jgi:hypothetical protein
LPCSVASISVIHDAAAVRASLHLSKATLAVSRLSTNGIYTCFSHFGLWSSYVRVWGLGTIASVAKFNELIYRVRSGDTACLTQLDDPPYAGLQYPYEAWFNNLFEAAVKEVEAFGRGELGGEEAAQRIFQHQ